MKNKSELIDNVYLRYKGDGHLRFSLPVELCGSHVAAQIRETLQNAPGVYRVVIFRAKRKLSIRFDNSATDTKKIAIHLKKAIDGLPDNTLDEAPEAPKSAKEKVRAKIGQIWNLFKAKHNNVHRKKASNVDQLMEFLKNPLTFSKKEKEKFLFSLLNDALLFYLIKIHWKTITEKMLKRPLTYIGQWGALFYLVMLYVKHQRESKQDDNS